MRASPDDQFPVVSASPATDERVAFKHVDRGDDVLYVRRRALHVMLREMVENTVEVLGDFGGQLDASHAQRAIFLALGRGGLLPATRSSR